MKRSMLAVVATATFAMLMSFGGFVSAEPPNFQRMPNPNLDRSRANIPAALGRTCAAQNYRCASGFRCQFVNPRNAPLGRSGHTVLYRCVPNSGTQACPSGYQMRNFNQRDGSYSCAPRTSPSCSTRYPGNPTPNRPGYECLNNG